LATMLLKPSAQAMCWNWDQFTEHWAGNSSALNRVCVRVEPRKDEFCQCVRSVPGKEVLVAKKNNNNKKVWAHWIGWFHTNCEGCMCIQMMSSLDMG